MLVGGRSTAAFRAACQACGWHAGTVVPLGAWWHHTGCAPTCCAEAASEEEEEEKQQGAMSQVLIGHLASYEASAAAGRCWCRPQQHARCRLGCLVSNHVAFIHSDLRLSWSAGHGQGGSGVHQRVRVRDDGAGWVVGAACVAAGHAHRHGESLRGAAGLAL